MALEFGFEELKEKSGKGIVSILERNNLSWYFENHLTLLIQKVTYLSNYV